MNGEERLQQLVGGLVEKLAPRSLWLFGSRAEGRARPDSDWDVIIVTDDDLDDRKLYELATPLREGIAVDLVPWRLDRFEVDRCLPGCIAYAAFSRGRELYRAPGFAWGPSATPAARAAALEFWFDGFLRTAEDFLDSQRFRWANSTTPHSRRERVEMGIMESETLPHIIVRQLLQALLMARGIDHGATRKLRSLADLLSVGDPGRGLIDAVLLEDDDDDGIADPEILAAAIAAVRADLIDRLNDQTITRYDCWR